MKNLLRLRPAGTLWTSPAFKRLWSAAAISAAGDQITKMALPIIAVSTLGAGPFEVGLLLTFEQLPQLLYTLLAGAWIDRVPRKPVIFICDVGRALVLLAVPVLAWTDSLSMTGLFAIGFLAGVFTTWHTIAWQSLLPSIATGSNMLAGTASVSQVEAMAEVSGPVLGGALIGVAGAPVAVLIDAVSFTGSAALISQIQVDETISTENRPPILHEIRDGIASLFRDPILRAIATSGCLGVFFFAIREPLLRVFLLDDLDLSPGKYGLVFTFAAIGYAIGTFLPGPVSRRFGVGNSIVWPHLALVIPGIGVAAAVTLDSAAPLVIAAFLCLEGIIEPINDINQLTLRLTLMPREMRGRLTSTTRFLVKGAFPLGTLVGGVLGETLGISTAIWISVLAGPLGAACYLGSPILRYHRLPDLPKE